MKRYNFDGHVPSSNETSDRKHRTRMGISGPRKMLCAALLGAGIFGCAGMKGYTPAGVVPEGTVVETLSHDGELREFLVYVPSSYDGSEAVPLLFNFHGYGGTAQDFMAWTDMQALADTENFILVYPQGALLDGSPHWNSALMGGDNKSTTDDLGFFEAMLDEIAASYHVDLDRVYTSGYSNGAFFSYALACYRSELVAAVASVSGTMMGGQLDSCDPSHPTAMINIHGTDDGVVQYTGSPGYPAIDAVMRFWIDFNGTNLTPITATDGVIESSIYTGGAGNTELAHYKVNGGEHVWFEMEYEGRNTGELIWDFVSRYDQNGQISAE